MSFADVQGMLQRGEVVAADYVAGPGVNGWTLISAVPALSLSSGHAGAAQPGAPVAEGYNPGEFGAGPQGADAAPAQPQSSWWRERLTALAIAGGGAVALLANVGTIMWNETFYPKLVALGGCLLLFGGWQVVFGDDKDDYTMEQVKWKTAGQYIAGALGLGLGLAVSFWLAE